MFVSLEGPDGAGKTTQAQLLVAKLEASDRRAILVHEPGGTDLGVHVRALLVGRTWTAIDPWAEALLFSACRAQLVREVIRPALEQGLLVIADRFADSTLAYQGAGRGLSRSPLQTLIEIATGGLQPDLTVLLDLPAEVGLARNLGPAGGQDVAGQMAFFEELQLAQDWNRFEDEAVAFHGRVQQAYREMAACDPARWVVVDATKGRDIVAAEVWSVVQARLPKPSPSDGGG
ncbi:MAG: dTMP kinase [Chloroflexi bacterium]|nr:dTMP kinase [Chloroflexota bacterium]